MTGPTLDELAARVDALAVAMERIEARVPAEELTSRRWYMRTGNKALVTGALIIVTALIAYGCQVLLGWDVRTVLTVEALVLSCYGVA